MVIGVAKQKGFVESQPGNGKVPISFLSTGVSRSDINLNRATKAFGSLFNKKKKIKK